MFTTNSQAKISYKIVTDVATCVYVTMPMIVSTIYNGITVKLATICGQTFIQKVI